MSCSIDVNILIYASDESSPLHQTARTLLRTLLADRLHLGYVVLMSYLRIVTNPRVMTKPLSSAEGLVNIAQLVRSPRVRLLSEEDGFFQVYEKVTRGIPVRGNLVPDAHLAALLIQHGVREIYSNDSDFRKFADLKVINPF